MEVVADFVDCAGFGFREVALFVKSIFKSRVRSISDIANGAKLTLFEKETDLISAGKKIVISNMLSICAFAG